MNIFDKLYTDYPKICESKAEIDAAFRRLKKCVSDGGLIMICGNGGSAADSEHITGELMKGFNLRRPLSADEKKLFGGIDGGEDIANKLQGAIRAVSLVSQTAVISAFANDIDPALVFAQQVWGYAEKKSDCLIALSTSGNSKNIVAAAKTAKAKGIGSIAITGSKESALSSLCDITIRLPANTPYEVQELTLPVYHALCAALEAEFFGE